MRKFTATLAVATAAVLSVFAGTAAAKYPAHYDVYGYCQPWQSGQWLQSPNGTWSECVYTPGRTFTNFGWVHLSDL